MKRKPRLLRDEVASSRYPGKGMQRIYLDGGPKGVSCHGFRFRGKGLQQYFYVNFFEGSKFKGKN